MLDLNTLKYDLKTEALRLGFCHFGVAPALPVPHYDAFLAWLQQGYQGEMGYLAREDTVAKRGNPQLILENCERVICLAFPYDSPTRGLEDIPQGMGRLSAYALTRDYHETLLEKLAQLEDFIRTTAGETVALKAYVDTGAILEKPYASQAGIGIAGKNSCLLIPKSGSWFFLAEILTDLALPVDEPFTRDLCGSCTRCIDACPTGCILPNRTLDASRCISYLTIEGKGSVPDDLKSQMGAWVFGCDVCQIVCPHNARTPRQNHALGDPRLQELLDLSRLFSIDENAFKAEFGETPVSRARRAGLLRNAAVVLGNQQVTEAIPILQRALAQETDPALKDACTWALDQIQKSTPLVQREPASDG